MYSDAQTQSLKNWIPYRLDVGEGQLLFRWLYAADHRFVEPFFDETVAHCKSHPYNSTGWHSVSTLEGLLDAAGGCSGVNPTAFIFHVSRCGSTLLSQLLAIPKRHIMLSEMPLIDAILRLPYTIPAYTLSEEDQHAAVKAVIRLLGAQRTGNETRLFIKLDSWNLLFCEVFRRLYPKVPFVFLYRSPDTVIRSHQKRRGMQAVPGLIEPELFGFDRATVQSMTLDHYTATVLERYFQTMLTVLEQDTNVCLLNYQANGPAMLEQLTRALQVDVRPAERDFMTQRSLYHAKYPDQPFSEIMSYKPIAADLEPVMQLYHQLDEKRSLTT